MSAIEAACPVCGSQRSQKLYPQYTGRCVTSQMFFLDGIVLDNRCCLACGFIFNARGVRGIEAEVYTSTAWTPKPQLMVHGGKGGNAHRRYLEVFLSLAETPQRGAILDCGAGTGAFLKEFHKARPGWELVGIEPGGGFAELTECFPEVRAFNKPYGEVALEQTFDLVASLSVLEHVADPLAALRWMRDRLAPGGKLLLQLPNFAKLPGDIFCADHINKMTVEHTRHLVERAGFELMASDDTAVMFYFVLGKARPGDGVFSGCPESNLALARGCEAVAKATVACVEACVASARGKAKHAAVFGTSPVGTMAPLVLNCLNEVVGFVDENPNAWGRNIGGMPVVGPEKMAEMGVSDLALAISPLYWTSVAEKMRAFDVQVHVPALGAVSE